MAKREFENGKFTKAATQKWCAEIKLSIIEQETRHPIPKRKGIRETVLEEYHKKGILEAYKIIEEFNKRAGKTIYTREMFENWIKEDDKNYRGQGKNDGYDR